MYASQDEIKMSSRRWCHGSPDNQGSLVRHQPPESFLEMFEDIHLNSSGSSVHVLVHPRTIHT